MANEPQQPNQPRRPNEPQGTIRDDPGQRNMPSQRGTAQGTTATSGSARSTTATISREYETRERRERGAAPPEYRPPKHHLPMKIAGILGLLLLGGLIAGLVASHPVSTPRHVAARTLSSFGATGSAVSPSFRVPSSPVAATYGYRCPAGVTGRFTASMVNSAGSDVQSIVSTTATSASGAKTLHPRHVGSPYHFTMTAPAGCAYRVNAGVP